MYLLQCAGLAMVIPRHANGPVLLGEARRTSGGVRFFQNILWFTCPACKAPLSSALLGINTLSLTIKGLT